jgi:hypothetical protein
MINYKHFREKTSLEDEIRSYIRIEMFLTYRFAIYILVSIWIIAIDIVDIDFVSTRLTGDINITIVNVRDCVISA